MQDEYLRFPAVRGITKLSRCTLWRMEKEMRFPLRRKLSHNAVGWLRSEVEEWVRSRQPVKV